MSESNYYNRYWSDVSTPSNQAFRKWNEERGKALLAALSCIPRGSKVLDAGCGEGLFSGIISREGHQVTAMDVSDIALDKAKRENQKEEIRYIKGSFEDRLPFADGEFSVVWCSEVLEHIFDIHEVLKEFNRILAGEGALIATVPYHGKAKMLAISLIGFEKHFNPYLSHIRFFSRNSLETCLANAGFVTTSCKGIGRFYPFYMSLFVVAGKAAPPVIDEIRIEG